MVTDAGRRGRWRVHVAWLLAATVAGVGLFWAGREFAAPAPQRIVELPPAATVVARAGEVGETSTLQGLVAFEEGMTVFSGNAGVVTSISVDPQKPVKSGAVVATVNSSPVVIAQGTTPAFRDMVEGNRGTDVKQLQAFLDVPSGDGVFGPATRRAVLEWKRSLGMRYPNATVPLGLVAFVPSLPVRAVPAEDVVVGSTVSVGHPLLVSLRERPVVSVLVDAAPKAQTGMPATMQLADERVTGRVGPVAVIDGLQRYLILDDAGEGICDAECGAGFAVEGETPVSVEVEVSPVVAGVVVPSAAVGVQPDGSRAVRTFAGDIIPVQITAEASGMAVVEGLEDGTEIVLFADTP